ncbi:MAG: hypothetical protein SVR94_14180 [Pseudomonadota bacterium]|nr:hypothetical protein [Pseudomonadota bacterium]
MDIQTNKIFFIILMTIILVYIGFFIIKEINKMNVMRWRTVSDEWINTIKKVNVSLSKEYLLASAEKCIEIRDTDLIFFFTIDLSNQVSHHLFFIESIRFEKILYKGQFRPNITIKKVPYCARYQYTPDNFKEDTYDALAFRLFDLENKRAVFWSGDYGYPYYNGKVNQVTFFGHHSEEYHGYYKVEQR